MIDVETEEILSLAQATKFVPKVRGKKVHVSTLYRWALGAVGGVQLETIKIGGSRCTSREALARFFDRLTYPEKRPEVILSARRRREIAAAEAALDRAGIR